MHDAKLALPVYDIELMKKLFAVKSGAKVSAAAAAAAATARLLTLPLRVLRLRATDRSH